MITIVVADDHAMFRQGLTSMLQQAGFKVVAECANGTEALAAIRKFKPKVALLDVTMPELDGIAVTAKVAQELKDVKVIILTMHDAADVCSRALASGAVGYIHKDDAFQELEKAIGQVQTGKTYISESVRKGLPNGEVGEAPALTRREEEILRLFARGFNNKGISAELYISVKTVDVHRTNMMRKLNIHSTAELVRYAFQTGLT